ncbi:hypothetical protein D5278_20945 [bacterium 1XD21-13]|nr:hypothetical protein [bacterium 1XD21-13]
MECISPSKEKLLASINPDMHLTKGFLKRIYGYSITEPEFAEQALTALEQAGCSKAQTYYKDWVNEYAAAYDAAMKPVADWYSRECEKAWEAKVKEVRASRRKKQKTKPSRQERWTELSEALGFPSTKKER